VVDLQIAGCNQFHAMMAMIAMAYAIDIEAHDLVIGLPNRNTE
jgi:hypothetical protein